MNLYKALKYRRRRAYDAMTMVLYRILNVRHNDIVAAFKKGLNNIGNKLEEGGANVMRRAQENHIKKFSPAAEKELRAANPNASDLDIKSALISAEKQGMAAMEEKIKNTSRGKKIAMGALDHPVTKVGAFAAGAGGTAAVASNRSEAAKKGWQTRKRNGNDKNIFG